MHAARYSARIGALIFAEDVSQVELLGRLTEQIVWAAVARAADESSWEQEELRRRGLSAVEFVRDGRALWSEAECYKAERKTAEAAGDGVRFEERNELDPEFFEKVDESLRVRWSNAGYEVPSLRAGMRGLFKELEAEARARAEEARELLVREILGQTS